MSAIVGYTYRADIYCPGCIIAAVARAYPGSVAPAAHDMDPEDALDQIAVYLDTGIDRDDEHTFDSMEFPKVVFSVQIDADENCARCDRIIDGDDLPVKRWIVTGTSMVVEAATEEEAIARAEQESGWHWEATEVI